MDYRQYEAYLKQRQAQMLQGIVYPNGNPYPVIAPFVAPKPAKMTHRDYLNSPLWKDRRDDFVRESGRRCAMLGIPAGKEAAGIAYRFIWIFYRFLPWIFSLMLTGKRRRLYVPKKRYWGCAIHHMHYRDGHQGNEVYGRDVINLCPFAHWIIHQVLGGHYRVTGQPFGRFPNGAQKLAHLWCCTPWNMRVFGMLAIVSFVVIQGL